eukprot:jgi/Psemu1/36675/gm1.36675_g
MLSDVPNFQPAPSVLAISLFDCGLLWLRLRQRGPRCASACSPPSSCLLACFPLLHYIPPAATIVLPDSPLLCFQPRLSPDRRSIHPITAQQQPSRESTLLPRIHQPSATTINIAALASLSPSNRYTPIPIMPNPPTPTQPREGRSSASSPKKRLQSTPSLSSSSARSSASGSRYPKRAHLKKSSTPSPAPTQATPSPSSLRPRKDASMSAGSSSSASQSSVTSMSVSSSDSSVASSTQSSKKPAPPSRSQA